MKSERYDGPGCIVPWIVTGIIFAGLWIATDVLGYTDTMTNAVNTSGDRFGAALYWLENNYFTIMGQSFPWLVAFGLPFVVLMIFLAFAQYPGQRLIKNGCMVAICFWIVIIVVGGCRAILDMP